MSQGDSAIDVSVSAPRGNGPERATIPPLIRAGHSFSGRERNCAFLNIGNQPFADVSTISGLDFADDARAIAQVDWDLDGDLDLWVSNRNGPQVRFLLNDVPTNYHYLAFRLEGRTCNRDAIGARLELVLAGKSSKKLIKTLRAGDGYLSQSSKWVHFGIGNARAIDRLIVHWPGGSAELFRGLAPDSRYRIVQGSGNAEPWQMPDREVNLVSSNLNVPPSSGRTQTFLASRLPLPQLTYSSDDGQSRYVTPTDGRPLLLKLWASWCSLCASQMNEFARRSGELNRLELDVLALSVDHLGDGNEGSQMAWQTAYRALDKLNYPYRQGLATNQLLDVLQIVFDQLFDRHVPLPLPTSVLIDGEGQLAAIYRGPIEIDRLFLDLGKLPLRGEQQRHAALEFAGRWLSSPARISLVPLFNDLVREGFRHEAIGFAASNRSRFPESIINAGLMVADGDRLLREQDLEMAEQRFREATRMEPSHANALVKWGVVRERRGNPTEAEAKYRQALMLDPDSVTAHFALALLEKNSRRTSEAIEHFRKVTNLQPDHMPTLYHLAELLATDSDPRNRDGEQAVMLAEKVAKATKYGRPDVLNILSAAYAETGDFDKAISTATRAIPLARAGSDVDLTRELETRLSYYKRREPYHGDPTER